MTESFDGASIVVGPVTMSRDGVFHGTMPSSTDPPGKLR
jgi:hypothetical protein